MAIGSDQPSYRVGQIVNLPVAQDESTDYYFPMEVVAVNGNELTLRRRLKYDPTILEHYFGKEA